MSKPVIFLGSNYQTYEFPKKGHSYQSVTLCVSKGETGMYSIGDELDLDVLDLKSRESGIKLFKGATGVDVTKLPKFIKSKKCKCKNPKEAVVRKGEPEELYYCLKCGRFVREWRQCRTKRK